MPESLEKTSSHLCEGLPWAEVTFRMSLQGMQPEGIELDKSQGLKARSVQS